MPVTAQDLKRLSAGFVYLRDFDCLKGDNDDLWPYDLDRALKADEWLTLAKACSIVNDGGCHSVSPTFLDQVDRMRSAEQAFAEARAEQEGDTDV